MSTKQDFLAGREARDAPGFNFKPGMFVWYDFMSSDFHGLWWAGEEEWVLSRGAEHRIIDVRAYKGEVFEVCISLQDEGNEAQWLSAKNVVPHPDSLALSPQELRMKELVECLKWYVENDDVQEGGRWEEVNAHWIEGKRRAMKVLGMDK